MIAFLDSDDEWMSPENRVTGKQVKNRIIKVFLFIQTKFG